jgi:hypothetical protein
VLKSHAAQLRSSVFTLILTYNGDVILYSLGHIYREFNRFGKKQDPLLVGFDISTQLNVNDARVVGDQSLLMLPCGLIRFADAMQWLLPGAVS